MKVSLISATPNAAQLLVFTKSTRLNLSPGLLDEIAAWPPDRIRDELRYMANTIPSSWEFVDYVFCIEGVSRAYTHQQVRTRAGSYAQQTMRVLDMGAFDFVWPKKIAQSEAAAGVVSDVLAAIRFAYRRLRETGIPAEDARSILPTNTSTNIVAKFNLRTLSELVRSRSGGRTQDEFRDVVRAMADAVLAVHPWADLFLFPQGRDLFSEIEAFAEEEFGGDLVRKGRLLKIVDQLRRRASS